MSISPNHLRIGNWVLYDGRYFKIYSISTELPCLDTIEFGIGVVEWDDLEPIPLTEEILVACGFEKNGSFWNLDEFQILLGYTESFGDFFHFTVDETVVSTAQKYVHQLQNLYFALTGNELNINL